MALGDYERQQSKLARGAKDKEHAREAQCRNRRNRHRYRRELVPHRRSRSARWILLWLNALTEYLLLVSVFETLDIVDDVDSGRGANQCTRDQHHVTKAVGHHQGHSAAIPL